MTPSKVTDSYVLAIWKKINKKRRICSIRDKLRVGKHVRISKENMKFAKSAEQNFSLEIFRLLKMIKKTPRPVREVQNFNKTPIEGQFYQIELTPVRITKQTTY
jgi:hypothetical protein